MSNQIENLEGEIWKPVVGYEARYEVSNKGRVRSIDREIISQANGTKWQYPRTIKQKGVIIKGKLLKGGKTRVGYMVIDVGRLYKDNKIVRKSKKIMLHRLVAEAWIPNPDNKPEINHIDGNKLNNNIENLAWCTRSENIKHAYDTGLLTSNGPGYGKDNHRAKMVIRMDKEGNELEIFYCATAISVAMGMSKDAITNAIKTNTLCGGYKWKYV